MRGEVLTGMIKNPHSLDNVTVNELMELTRQYPWCASFRMLLLKKMHATNHPEFDRQLALDALRVGDRSVLYQLIHAPVEIAAKTETAPAEIAAEAEPEVTEVSIGHEPITVQPVIESDSASTEETEKSTEPMPDTSDAETQSGQDPGEDLIERFIKEEPRIVPREGDFAESVRIAARSNEPALDLVTETLANIYLQQGDKNKAIKIFERLSLTLPEKRSYFAARIAEVRNEANKL